MTDKVKYSSSARQRFAELDVSQNGRYQAEWKLTDSSLTDLVKLTLPPDRVVPIIFVPGIMGSNLCNLKNQPIWLLNAVGSTPIGLAYAWAGKRAGHRQKLLHPDRTKVYMAGNVPKTAKQGTRSLTDYIKRGWGEVSEASYHKFLLWLEQKMNGDRNPKNWTNFTHSSLSDNSGTVQWMTQKLAPGLEMKMPGMPESAEQGHRVESIKSDDLLKRSKSIYPVYAFGYNWLASNDDAADALKERIERVIAENNRGAVKCTQVILVTHSMGGLVARACNQLPGISNKIVGIVHGVMPATGAAVAYRRCKIGMKDEDPVAGLVIGADGKEVTAVFAQAPGALQLLPSKDYGVKWLEISDPGGKNITALPLSDPYEEIYLEKNKWWGLVKNEWLSPEDGERFNWDKFSKNIKVAREFHKNISKQYHRNTYVFYGGGLKKGSFSKIRWSIKKGVTPSRAFENPAASPYEIGQLKHFQIRTNGSNNLYVGGETVIHTSTRGDAQNQYETSFWEVRCASYDSSGDGTVPANSGRAPREGGGRNILQQFELSDIEHEPAYRDYPTAQLVTLYAVTKLAAIAELS